MYNNIRKSDRRERILRAISSALLCIVDLFWRKLSWEDFLDFSKMSPSFCEYAISQRLKSNFSSKRFKQHYVVLVHLILILVGVTYNTKVIVALTFSAVIWISIFVGVLECGLMKKGGLFRSTKDLVVKV
mmetsp:Transcript_5573/g.7509  ORF Transcript_5573/g.7509 Transcript_5573/m.7509 type:complete len:130 (-) Transcript_5573:1022-1411(-)